MTAEQKLDILRLRKEGMKTKDIAEKVRLSEPNVKKILHDVHDDETICLNCGAIIKKSKYKPRKYCSPKCKFEYYKLHPEITAKKTYHRLICQCCHREFLSYAKAKRKYCSKSCASKSRFK